MPGLPGTATGNYTLRSAFAVLQTLRIHLTLMRLILRY